MTNKRKSGLLMHINSLPGPDGIGTLGAPVKNWIDAMAAAGQTLWQILPLGPTGYGNSPYAAWSAFAGNPLLIDLSVFESDIYESEAFKELSGKSEIDYDKLIALKVPILKKFAQKFISEKANEDVDYKNFKEKNKFWLNDYALFYALKEIFDKKAFFKFPEDIRIRKQEALHEYGTKLSMEIEIEKAIQYFFFKQWYEAKSYANYRKIKIIGDIPLYVAEDSSDVWANPEIFMLDEKFTPLKVAGVPPDYFSETGQLWGNPVYDWEYLKNNGFNWWIERIKFNFELFDILRIDHFRGLAAFWAVPYGSKTAQNGEWLPCPGSELFDAIFKNVPQATIIAEDLGVMTDDVIQLRDKYNLPGMKILQFAFDAGSDNAFLPHNYNKNCVVYTGTHDNDTSKGWFANADADEKAYCKQYTRASAEDISLSLIKTAFSSVANTVIVPMQDVLELDSKYRMNTPGVLGGNWEWRMLPNAFNEKHKNFLLNITKIYGRDLEPEKKESKY